MKNKIIDNQEANKIRLVYVSINPYYSVDVLLLRKHYIITSPLTLPKDMNLKEACKYISYLTDKIEKDTDEKKDSIKNMIKVYETLKEKGFTKIETKNKGEYIITTKFKSFGKIKTEEIAEVPGCIDLFTIKGNTHAIKRTELKNRFFKWYTPNISEKDIIPIINKKSR